MESGERPRDRFGFNRGIDRIDGCYRRFIRRDIRLGNCGISKLQIGKVVQIMPKIVCPKCENLDCRCESTRKLTWDQAATEGLIYCLLDGDRGIYLPKAFADGFDLEAWKIDHMEEQIADLQNGPNSEYYDDSWQEILDEAFSSYEDSVHLELWPHSQLCLCAVYATASESFSGDDLGELVIQAKSWLAAQRAEGAGSGEGDE